MPKIVEEESWSSFHKKHHTQEFHYSSKNEAVRMNPLSSSGSSAFMMFEEDEDDGEGKGWLSSLVDLILMEPSQTEKSKARRALSDDDSFTSSDSKKASRKLFPKISKSCRRKGNIKLSRASR
jgi:hypothetical protein